MENYHGYLEDKKRELVRKGVPTVMPLGGSNLASAINGVEKLDNFLGIASSNNPATTILGEKHESWSETLTKSVHSEYNEEYDKRISELYRLKLEDFQDDNLAKFEVGVSEEMSNPFFKTLATYSVDPKDIEELSEDEFDIFEDDDYEEFEEDLNSSDFDDFSDFDYEEEFNEDEEEFYEFDEDDSESFDDYEGTEDEEDFDEDSDGDFDDFDEDEESDEFDEFDEESDEFDEFDEDSDGDFDIDEDDSDFDDYDEIYSSPRVSQPKPTLTSVPTRTKPQEPKLEVQDKAIVNILDFSAKMLRKNK